MRLLRRLLAATLPLVFGLSLAEAQDEPPRAEANAPAGAFIVKPYLQLGRAAAPGALALLWHAADVDAAWSVEFRPGKDAPWKQAEALASSRVTASGIAPHRVYRAALTGLPAGATFDYRVVQGNHEVFSASARAPKSAAQPYRFVAFGDCGAGSAEQLPLAYRAFLARPDFVVIPGDIVYDRGRISEYRTRFWPVYNADEPAPTSGVPLLRSTLFVAAPGNHDTASRDLNRYPDGLGYYLYWDQPLNGPLAREGSAFVPPLTASDDDRRAFMSAAGAAYPRMTNFSFDYGNAHWTIVDSNPYVDWTDPELIRWVERDLAAAQWATWRFVAFHHPPFNSAREHFEQQQTRLLVPVLQAGNVDLVFNDVSDRSPVPLILGVSY